MTLALRCFIVGLLCGLLVGYLYKPDLIVVVCAFVIGHFMALGVWWCAEMLEKDV